MQIGFIGLGARVSARAKNLAAEGHHVRAWNRSGGAITGVTMVETAAEAFDADAVLTMLSDDDAIRAVVLAPDLLRALAPDWSMSSRRRFRSPSRRISWQHTPAPALARSLRPRSAGPMLPQKGELNILVGGDPKAIDSIRPIFEVISGRIWPVGADAPTADAAKIACNMMIARAIEAMAEAVVLTETNGLPREEFFALILGTLFGSRSYKVYSNNIARSEYQPDFKATLGLKDLRLAREAARDMGKALPMLNAVHERMAQAVDAGFGDQDWSAMAKFTIEN
ncbi:NAD(P)-dependent oxidoreductase [Sphingomonas sp. TREG-RG-20F-R18-01]|uniref:NAD(P)-dependent oxidoreductase n=1 Tax=Sphingomonas sp. TREG-RG-20F-R18-01 TaxID=2914982 RepID=UPI001F55F5E3|nr:NAD(P)-dependent oxidoreductase [Sphingomonas sp. TREG-RG-20F-R18-01]